MSPSRPAQGFLTVTVVARNQAERLEATLRKLGALVSPLVADYELVVVDNASDDHSVARLKELTGEGGHPNLQVYALTKQVDADTAAWVGLENALGDHVAVLDMEGDDAHFLPTMLQQTQKGADVVFATPRGHRGGSPIYRLAAAAFHWLYQRCNGVHLAREAPRYRMLSRRVIQFILQHPQPSLAYRHLPATGGFARVHVEVEAPAGRRQSEGLWAGCSRGIRLLIAGTAAPMRWVSGLSLTCALLNLVYSFYVIGVAFFKPDVAPGWITLSLQQSGMFFLLSLVLMMLGEYVAHLVGTTGSGPPYHVGQEFTSMRLTRRDRLNVERAQAELRPKPSAAHVA